MLAISTNKSAERTVLIRLLQVCSSLNEQLQVWHEDMKSQYHDQLYCVVPSAAHSPADDPIHGRVFPHAFHFPQLSVAQLLLLYWSTLILLHRTTQDIQKRLKSHVIQGTVMQQNLGPQNSINRSELHLDDSCLSDQRIAGLAKNICQSFEYCYHTKNGTLGLQSTVFPLWVAQDFYVSQSDKRRQAAWCSEIGSMTAPDSRFDLHVMKFSRDD